ncbi:MAG TPA: hypothetical protein VGD80_19405 [Kofleriaceae bacterium]
MPDDKPTAAAAPPEEGSRIGKFIVRYHTFLSSFVIGAAGLVATSIWQFRQAQTAQRQAEAQQKVAETQAENSWKIERAEILGKNLGVLASSGAGSADQRYGVLLSLTRADIIDPELTISYALELGKDNADYMQSVLANVTMKDYLRLSHAYVLSCEERYGTSPAIDACADPLAARSAAIGRIIADDVAAAVSAPVPGVAPATEPAAAPLVRPKSSSLTLLKDERVVQLNVQQLFGLFETALNELYERRQWDDLARFAGYSPGAHLVSALVLAAARTGELATEDENKVLDRFHDEQTRWLSDYLMSKACDAECKGRIVEVMVSHYEESQGDYDLALRKLLESPRSQSGSAVARLHARLLWCQIGEVDEIELRDHVLVPAIVDLLKSPTPDADASVALLGLLGTVPTPDPGDISLAPAVTAWTQAMALIDRSADKLDRARSGRAFKTMKDRRASVARQRQDPPRALKKLNFCAAVSEAAEADKE